MQLELQLADRNVSIELTEEAREWLVEHGYDEAMGARPMARLIQMSIKTQLAEDVLFGRLKNGGAVRVMVKTDDIGLKTLGFEYPEGPVKPEARESRGQAQVAGEIGRVAEAKKVVKPKGPGGNSGGGIRTVPKVPLVKA